MTAFSEKGGKTTNNINGEQRGLLASNPSCDCAFWGVATQETESQIAHCGCARVARWFIFKPKIPIWVNFGVRSNGKC
jgi:hypothetical protein